MKHHSYKQVENGSIEILTEGNKFFWHVCEPKCYPTYDSQSDELFESDSLEQCISDATIYFSYKSIAFAAN